jgi:hypothetical protein
MIEKEPVKVDGDDEEELPPSQPLVISTQVEDSDNEEDIKVVPVAVPEPVIMPPEPPVTVEPEVVKETVETSEEPAVVKKKVVKKKIVTSST